MVDPHGCCAKCERMGMADKGKRPFSKSLRARARGFRHAMTPGEEIVRKRLRNRPLGAKVGRQAAPTILDRWALGRLRPPAPA